MVGTYSLFFIISLVTVLAVTPLVQRLAIRWGVLDRPGRRKIHQGEIPRLGGVAVWFASLVPFLVLLIWQDLSVVPLETAWAPLVGLLLGSLVVFAVGIWDDISRLSPWVKLAAEVAASLIVVSFGLKMRLFTNPFGYQLALNWLGIPLTVLWLVGITNAVNLADGIDGLATGVAAFGAFILFIMTYSTVHTLVSLLAMALAGATLGFLRYNFYPATIFLGDSGSLFLGFYLGGLSIWASEKSTITFAILIPIVALGLPLADMIYAVVRRWTRGVPLKQADREHIHHKLLDMGFAQRATVLILYAVNIFLVLLAGTLLLTRNSWAAYILVLLGLALIVGSRFLGYFRFSRLLKNPVRRWRDFQQSKYIAFRARWLRQAFEREKRLEQRWALTTELWGDLGFRQALFNPAGTAFPPLQWRNPDQSEDRSGAARELTLTLSLLGDREEIGTLHLTWSSDTQPLPPGLEKLLTIMAHDFGRTVNQSGATNP